jgi:hypothetical protein
MSIAWNAEQILALAPDASAAKAGNALAQTSKWLRLGFDSRAVWGECQGSGKSPYQTKIDMREPAFACSCPSRKLPCKHGLGLFLLLAANESAFTQKTPPAWVSEWLAKRDNRQEQRAQKETESKAKQVDTKAQTRRAEQRTKKVEAGIADLEQWLRDLIRQGLAAAQTKPPRFWTEQAARLVDAQAPGVARLLQQMAYLPHSGDKWQERLLERLARLHLLLESYKRIETLPAALQVDIRATIGWTQNQEDLLQQTGERDLWLVAGQRTEEDERLRTQRTWLVGQTTGRPALILQVAFGREPFKEQLIASSLVDAELVFFESAYPLRALVKSRGETVSLAIPQTAYANMNQVMEAYAQSLLQNPWLELFPALLSPVTLMQAESRWFLHDTEDKDLPLSARFQRIGHLLAITGGHPFAIFGEWNGDALLPLSIWTDGKFINLSQ